MCIRDSCSSSGRSIPIVCSTALRGGPRAAEDEEQSRERVAGESEEPGLSGEEGPERPGSDRVAEIQDNDESRRAQDHDGHHGRGAFGVLSGNPAGAKSGEKDLRCRDDRPHTAPDAPRRSRCGACVKKDERSERQEENREAGREQVSEAEACDLGPITGRPATEEDYDAGEARDGDRRLYENDQGFDRIQDHGITRVAWIGGSAGGTAPPRPRRPTNLSLIHI